MSAGWYDPLADRLGEAFGSEWQGVEVAVVLGSGAGVLAEAVAVGAALPYAQVPGLGSCTVPGHAGRLLRGRLAGREVLVFQGRRHLCEGLAPAVVALPARIAAHLGVRLLVLLSAVGSVAPSLEPGDWLFVDDHLNLSGRNPLEGVSGPRGPPFVDLTRVYRSDLFPALRASLLEGGVRLERGVYGFFPGPTYETPAEVQMAGRLGADVVGMSVVPEAVWARFLGLQVVALARVANAGAGLVPEPLSHAAVMAALDRGAWQVQTVVEQTLGVWDGCPAAGGCGPRSPNGSG